MNGITFKYENVPMFCFICGLLGHSEKFCSQLFEKQESEIVKLYGPWMRAPFRRQNKQIGANWLRNEDEDVQATMETGGSSLQQKAEGSTMGEKSGTKIMEDNVDGVDCGNGKAVGKAVGKQSAVLNSNTSINGDKDTRAGKRNVTVLENKKKKN